MTSLVLLRCLTLGQDTATVLVLGDGPASMRNRLASLPISWVFRKLVTSSQQENVGTNQTNIMHILTRKYSKSGYRDLLYFLFQYFHQNKLACLAGLAESCCMKDEKKRCD